MNISEAIAELQDQVKNPSAGLPDELFYYVSSITPLINVDLLIKDEKGRTLLSMRDDKYAGRGWHIPGGIIRYKEKAETRIQKVAEKEIGAAVKYDINPIAINEIMDLNKTIRAHFISILYKCSLPSTFVPDNKGLSMNDPNYLKWHERCPDDLLFFHEIYRRYI